MDFTNTIVSPSELPTVEDIPFEPLEKDFLLVERISLGITLAILLAIAIPAFNFIEGLQSPLIISLSAGVFLIFSLLAYVSISISFSNSGYALRNRDVLYRSGWITRRLRVVMLNRVQHVSIQSGPIERKFGLSSVSIFTAGSSEADFTIKGITAQTAQNIKEWISTSLNGDTHN